jgi:PAS domain S-box-containing protein
MTSSPPDAGDPGASFDTLQELRRERDHLLLLHETLMEAERAATLEARLEICVSAISRVGFERVVLTLRDGELNTIGVVGVGLREEELRLLRDDPSPGSVWCERLTSIERFRISESYYLPGNDPLVAETFGGGVPSRLPPAPGSEWSPTDALLVPLRGVGGNIVATLLVDDPSDRARPSLTRVRTVELFGRQIAAMLERASHRALAERYRRVVETSRDAIVITDPQRRIAFANPAAIDFFGYGEALIGMPVAVTVPVEGRDHVRRREDDAFAGVPQRYEGGVVRGDGDHRTVSVTTAPLRERGEITGIVASLRDITDERARIAALERSEARYTRLVESASDAIFTLTSDGRFTAVNRALEHGVGRSRTELLDAPFAVVLDPRDLDAARDLLDRTIAGERCRGLLRYRTAGNDLRAGSVITAPVFEDGLIVGALGIMRDVTDEQRLAAQLLQQEKLAAVGQLVSGVAHELNNPLAGVMAFSELLLVARSAYDDETRRALETIHHEATRAAKIVSHLLTFARQRPAERMDADLNAIVTDTVALRRYALTTAQIELELALDPAMPHTWADPFQLQQVVLNLITNAEQALAEWSGPRRIAVWTRRDDDWLVIAVSDTGPGIPLEQRDRIFNPFYTTKAVGQGTGLGLSISDGIVREHGGQIRVESHPGAGATFLVQLPRVAPVGAPAAQPTPPAARTSAPRRVLVVDDEPSMRVAIATFLDSLGHAVTATHDGREARALLAANEYDVVLLDLRMSGLGGDTLYRELCQSDPRHARRVVFVTGDTQSEHARRFLAEAGRPSVSKPFQLDDLAAVLAGVTN